MYHIVELLVKELFVLIYQLQKYLGKIHIKYKFYITGKYASRGYTILNIFHITETKYLRYKMSVMHLNNVQRNETTS